MHKNPTISQLILNCFLIISEWEKVSKDAKDLIRGMLKTDPTERFTIDDVIRNKWVDVSIKTNEFPHEIQMYNILFLFFQQYTAVPQTPLLTSQVLKEENEQWPEVQQEMSQALREMRVDNDQVFDE